MSTRIDVYVKDINDYIDSLYERLDAIDADDNQSRKLLLQEIEQAESDVNQILGSWNQDESKYFDYDN